MSKSMRGSSLAGAICLIAISLLAVLTVGTSASMNVQMLLKSENAQVASQLADSAIQQALAELMEDGTWGNTSSTKIAYAGPVDHSEVQLTFDKTLGVPYCSKNDGDTASAAWPGSKLLRAGKVPGKRVHLVAVARCRNVQRVREAVVFVPNFTLSLGATGKVHLIESIVGALDTVADLDTIATNPEKLKPGDLATNSSDPQAALLESGSRVTGNLQASGGVDVLDGSTVGGEVRPFYSPAELPHFDFAAYDPAAGNALNYNTLPAGIQGDKNLTGVVRCDGPAVTINGNLDLDNALLFVNGDLKVTGSMKGSGAIVVTGKTTVEGGSGLTSADSVALLSQGDVRLVNPGSGKYTFQGLVYTRGNFTAKNFTVVGGFVADGLGAGQGNIEMEGCLAIRIPLFTDLRWYFPTQVVLQVAGTNGPGEVPVPLKRGPQNEVLQKYSYGLSPAIPFNYPSLPSIWKQTDGTIVTDTPPSYAAIATPGAAARFNNQVDGDGHWGDNPWWNPAVLQIRQAPVGNPEPYVYDVIYTENNVLHQTTYNTNLEASQAIADLGELRCPGYFAAPDHPGNAEHRDGFLGIINSWKSRNLLNEGDDRSGSISFDPNRFLKQSEKLRISAWVEY